MNKSSKVQAVACSHAASDEEVYSQVVKATADLPKAWEKLGKAKKIAIKFNQDLNVSNMFKGNRQELVSDSVARAVLRLLRERTSAELICVDASWFRIYDNGDPAETTNIAPLLDEFGVRYADCASLPLTECAVPGGGGLFSSYQFSTELIEADELVSVAKMKNHAFMGVTGSLKNLFGLMAAEPYARPRAYYHHLVRMPYMLCDIGKILNPALNVIDALVGQAFREWTKEPGHGRVVDALIAGDHPVATDTCMAHLMGHNPEADWLTDPFLRDRNTLKVAAERGFGSNVLEDIDFTSDVSPRPPGTFYCEATDSAETTALWRKSMCEEALQYRDNMKRYAEYDGEYVLLQEGKVVWHGPEGRVRVSRRKLAGKQKNRALFFKYVDLEESEQERYEIYEQALEHIKELDI